MSLSLNELIIYQRFGYVCLFDSSFKWIEVSLRIRYIVEVNYFAFGLSVANFNTNSATRSLIYQQMYSMRLAIKVLDSVIMKNAERKTRFLINSWRIFLHMSLLLNSFKLTKHKYRCIFYGMFLSTFFQCFSLFFYNMCENGMIYWYSINIVDLFDKFETHRTSHSSIPS